MHLLYCDETNLAERSGDFLIYGGLVIDGTQARNLSKAIDDLRTRYAVPRDFRLKFNPGPKELSNSQFIALKQEALSICAAHGARLLAYVVLHDIAINPDEARRAGINTVCYHFDCTLNRVDVSGLVLIDRFNDAGNEIDSHLRQKFSIGVKGLPYSAEMRLANIVGFHYSALGQSHFTSLVDIALGSLRFAINAHTRGQSKQFSTAMVLLGILSPLFWREAGQASTTAISELGFTFSPKAVKIARYRDQYQSLKDFLARGGLETSQPITGQPFY